jgi:hypothetical protein
MMSANENSDPRLIQRSPKRSKDPKIQRSKDPNQKGARGGVKKGGSENCPLFLWGLKKGGMKTAPVF